MSQVSARRRKGFLAFTAVLLVAAGLTSGVNLRRWGVGKATGVSGGVRVGLHTGLGRRARTARGGQRAARPRRRERPPAGACRRVSAPERAGDLLAVQADSGRRARGGQAAVKRRRVRRGGRSRRRRCGLNTAGRWEPLGTTPLIADDKRLRQVGGERARRPQRTDRRLRLRRAGNRLFAAVGEGGVWESDDVGRPLALDRRHLAHPGRGRHRLRRRHAGDRHRRQRVRRRRHVRRPRRLLLDRRRGDLAALGGVPRGVIAFKVAADAAHPACSTPPRGPGLFRSTDDGADFTNVNLPRRRVRRRRAGPPHCALANMVTDVASARPAGRGGSARPPAPCSRRSAGGPGHKPSPYGTWAESPGNGVYALHRRAGHVPARRYVPGHLEPGPDRARPGDGAGAGPPLRLRHGRGRDQVQQRADRRGTQRRVPAPTNFGGVYVSSRLRPDLDADGVGRGDGRRRRLGSRAERHRVRRIAVLPGDPVLVQPVDRGRPRRGGRERACRRGWRSASRRSGAPPGTPMNGPTEVRGHRPVLLRQHLPVPQPRPGVPDDAQRPDAVQHDDAPRSARRAVGARRRAACAAGGQRRRHLHAGRSAAVGRPIARQLGPRREPRLPHAAAL